MWALILSLQQNTKLTTVSDGPGIVQALHKFILTIKSKAYFPSLRTTTSANSKPVYHSSCT